MRASTASPLRRLACALVVGALTVLAACGGGDAGTGPGGDDPGPGGAIDVTGSWISSSVNAAQVPSSQYDLVQTGSTLSGEAFWRWEGGLERIGPVSGSIDPDGSAQWTTTLNDNGWDGVETAEARFTGVAAASQGIGGSVVAASDAAGAGSAGNVSGTFVWSSPNGATRESGPFQLNRPTVSEPAAGTGSLGAAGPWRGAMFYTSIGACHTTGFIITMALTVNGDRVTGRLSAKPHPRGGALPTTLQRWYGYLESNVTGNLLRSSGRSRLSLTLSGAVNGLLDGDLTDGSGATQFLGVFQGANPCEDSRETTDRGTFVFNSERVVVF